ncbi:Hpt domain-containing protein [Arthrobacter sp. C152]
MDLTILRDLEDELELPLVRNFARDYIGMWEYRCQRLSTAVTCRDGRDGALDAAISLKVTSGMVGGLRLADLAGTFEDRIRQGAVQEAAILLNEIKACGEGTVAALWLRYCGQC